MVDKSMIMSLRFCKYHLSGLTVTVSQTFDIEPTAFLYRRNKKKKKKKTKTRRNKYYWEMKLLKVKVISLAHPTPKKTFLKKKKEVGR